MFDIFAKLLSSVASFLFPLFASYKALQTSDPAQLTPWLMYWVVLACALLVESWTDWFLAWIPFYAYLRLLFLLYLVLPQTQGARIIYQTHLQPWLHDNEQQIEDFIASAHHRLKQAGISYLKHAIELLRTNLLGLPPSPPSPSPTTSAAPDLAPGQSYTQALLARFSLPSARWAGRDGPGAATTDFYNLLASAVGAATAATATGSGTGATEPRGPENGPGGMAASGLLAVPDSIQGASARRSFIAAQRERLALLVAALDREAGRLESSVAEEEGEGEREGAPLAKSRSEADFEKLEAESGEEEEDAGLRRRTPGVGSQAAGWVSWAWGGGGTGGGGAASADAGKSTGVEK
ncbi:hypothetical protein BR93DRAFT_918322 [Coniochaeta sp. PMI_546]|nr:hypothetical protein BR93DRAFT_918322 [Coniochaeta sp. PMI_546]